MKKKVLVTGGSGLIGSYLKDIMPSSTYVSSKDYNLLNENDVKNMLKDAEFGLSMADDKGINLPVLKAAADSMQSQMEKNRDDEDYSVVYRNFTD